MTGAPRVTLYGGKGVGKTTLFGPYAAGRRGDDDPFEDVLADLGERFPDLEPTVLPELAGQSVDALEVLAGRLPP